MFQPSLPHQTPPARDRRQRLEGFTRALTAETVLLPQHLILPLFITGEAADSPIQGLGSTKRQTISSAVATAQNAYALGIRMLALFPVVPRSHRDAAASAAFFSDGVLPEALRALKKALPAMGLMADVALDPYTSHGHDGLLGANGALDNDATVAALVRLSLVLAEAGADALAPSDMMDGRVAAIRAALEKAGMGERLIISYAAKFASNLYAPFRGAVDAGGLSAGPRDKKSYQLPIGNAREALKEALRDEAEGADMLMVKPALPYLDIVCRLREATRLPILAYIVSGESAMLHSAAAARCLDFLPALYEQLLCCRRAGADAVVCYDALEAAKYLAENSGSLLP